MHQVQWQSWCQLFLLSPLQTRVISKRHHFGMQAAAWPRRWQWAMKLGWEGAAQWGRDTLWWFLGPVMWVTLLYLQKDSSKPEWRLCPCFVPSLSLWVCVLSNSTTALPHASAYLACWQLAHLGTYATQHTLPLAEDYCWFRGQVSGTHCDYAK